MTIATSLRLRWERAQQIDPAGIEELGQGWYVVPSSRAPTGYAVHLEFDGAGKLTAASCTCPDFVQRTVGADAPTLHGQRICKHVLAVALKAKGIVPRAPDPPAPAAAREDQPPPAEPAWDQACAEWVATDEEGVHRCGASPSECARQLDEARHYRAEHARKNGHRLIEPRTQPAEVTKGEPAAATSSARLTCS